MIKTLLPVIIGLSNQISILVACFRQFVCDLFTQMVICGISVTVMRQATGVQIRAEKSEF